MSDFDVVLRRLAAVIDSRRGGDPTRSWSAKLLADPTLAAKKMAEEAIEVALAAAQNDRAGVIAESADLIYHWLALLAACGVGLDEVASALEAREGQSGVAEKAGRKI
jgi:phosphoribosyl-ATP pyrophosphohydrolase